MGNARASRCGTGNEETPTPFLYGDQNTSINKTLAIGVAATKISAVATPKEYIYINTRDELLRLECEKIVYMEGDGNYTNIVLVNKLKASVGMNLLEMQRFLSESLRERASMFARIGKRFIVNLRFIHQVSVPRQTLTVTDGIHFAFQLGISKEALRQLKELMLAQANNQQPDQQRAVTTNKQS